MSYDIGAIIIAVIGVIFALFIGVFLVIALAPSIGQIGGSLDEVLFIVLGLFMVIGVIVAYAIGSSR